MTTAAADHHHVHVPPPPSGGPLAVHAARLAAGPVDDPLSSASASVSSR